MAKNTKRSFGLANVLSVEDLRSVLRSILYLLVGFCGLGAVIFFYTSIPGMQKWVMNTLLLSLVALISLFLLRWNNLAWVVSFALLAFGLTLFYISWTGAGVTGIAFIFNFLIVIGATTFWGEVAGIHAAAFTGLSGFILLMAGRFGWLQNYNTASPDALIWACLVACFLVSTRMIGVALRHLERAFENSRQELEERARAETEIRRLNAELEQTVARRTAELAESARLMKIISENIQDVIWTADMQLRTTFSTASASRMRGFTLEELENEPLEKAVTPESYARVAQVFQEELEKEARGGVDPNRSRVLQLDYYRKDGSTVPVELRASFLRDAQGRPIGLTGVSRDIRERKWMEAALLESEERYRKITSVISDYSYSAKIDQQGQFSPEWVAGALEEITGYAFDEFRANGGWVSVLHPDSVEQDKLDRDILLKNQPVNGSIIRITRKDGETRWVRNFVQPVWDNAENRLCGAYGGMQDITREKQAAERLEMLNVELEKRVAERTAQLETAMSELESFSYSISHDLRAPLRAVNGYAGILLTDHRREFSPAVAEKLELIRENGHGMGRLIDGLLEFLRSGSDTIIRQPVNPGEIVQRVLERLRPQYENRQVEIIIGDLPPCSANFRLLDKVFEGLVSNAVKFTRQRDLAQIEIGALEKDGQPVYFVRDNGVGFDMKYSKKLFGVFQRLHHTSEFEGIGASLAIAHRIINRHGGRIWAEAVPDKGAIFYFTIEAHII